MNRAVTLLTQTAIIAIALVVLGWLLGVVFPVAEVTGEITGPVAACFYRLPAPFCSPLPLPIRSVDLALTAELCSASSFWRCSG